MVTGDQPQPPGTASDLINNDPHPSGCTHRVGTTKVPIDTGTVSLCNGCSTAMVVHEWG
jgi:hypothetical protein